MSSSSRRRQSINIDDYLGINKIRPITEEAANKAEDELVKIVKRQKKEQREDTEEKSQLNPIKLAQKVLYAAESLRGNVTGIFVGHLGADSCYFVQSVEMRKYVNSHGVTFNGQTNPHSLSFITTPGENIVYMSDNFWFTVEQLSQKFSTSLETVKSRKTAVREFYERSEHQQIDDPNFMKVVSDYYDLLFTNSVDSRQRQLVTLCNLVMVLDQSSPVNVLQLVPGNDPSYRNIIHKRKIYQQKLTLLDQRISEYMDKYSLSSVPWLPYLYRLFLQKNERQG